MIKNPVRWINDLVAKFRDLVESDREKWMMLEGYAKYKEMDVSMGLDDPLFEILQLTNKGRAALNDQDADSAIKRLSYKHSLVLKIFGDNSPSSGTSFIDIGEAYLLANRRSEARTAFEKAYSILKSNRIYKEQILRLELLLKEVSALQGHNDRVQEVGNKSAKRLKRKGSNSSRDQAIALDENVRLLTLQGKFNEALPLARKALEIFERTDGHDGPHTGLCCLYFARIYRGLGRYTEAIVYGRRALYNAEVNFGDDSDETAKKADELAQSLALKADKDNDSVLATEAVELSHRALRIFKLASGEKDKGTLMCIENRKILLQMLQRFHDTEEFNASQESNDFALPTYCFISHSYSDDEALKVLLGILPEYVKPVIFEPIQVNVTEFVSDKLISGVLGSDGLLFIDSDQSNQSFWTAFERDLAIRNNKRIFAFDPVTNKITRYQRDLPQLNLVHTCHPDDKADVDSILRWLVKERSFVSIGDPSKAKAMSSLNVESLFDAVLNKCRNLHLIRPFAKNRKFSTIKSNIPKTNELENRENKLALINSSNSIYILFLSQLFLKSPELAGYALAQLEQHPSFTMICWLDNPGLIPTSNIGHKFCQIEKERSFTFSAPPSDSNFSSNELDDFMVRLYWIFHQTRREQQGL